VLIITAVAIAGCTQAPAPVVTPTPAPIATTAPAAVTTVVPQPSFSLGDHYLQKSYSFQSEKDLISEQFRVDDPSWGIDINVLPLNDNLQYCWFEIKVTNMDNGQTDTYGYGRSYSYEKHQQFPMYTTGPYKIDMTGNRVKVDVTAAKRKP
jgi:hypothetical protein